MKANVHGLNNDARAEARKVIAKLDELVKHLRDDAHNLEQPKAQALFETGAEVLIGLKKAFEDYEKGNERAMREP